VAGGIGHGGLVQIRRIPVTEGTAAGGQLNPAQARRRHTGGEPGGVSPGGALQALEDGGVLGVRGQQARAALGELRQHHWTSGDQGLLVGQGQVLAGADRRQGGQQAGAAHDPGDHQVGAGPGRGGAEPVRAAHQLRQLGGALTGGEGLEPLLQGREFGFIRQGHHLRGVLLDLADQQIEVVPGRQGDDAEAIGELLDDLEGLRTD